jgi:hypothetical protein
VGARHSARTGLLCGLAGAIVVALLLGAGAGRGLAAPRAGEEQYVRYYVVTDSYQGQPENLSEIASRFLGTADRAGELFHLNVGRRQPGGGTLTDPQVLRRGWQIVLPWDAVGPGARYGLLAAGVAAGVAQPRPSGGLAGADAAVAKAPPEDGHDVRPGVRAGVGVGVAARAAQAALAGLLLVGLATAAVLAWRARRARATPAATGHPATGEALDLPVHAAPADATGIVGRSAPATPARPVGPVGPAAPVNPVSTAGSAASADRITPADELHGTASAAKRADAAKR